MKIVNCETKLQVIFGVVDEDGDCVQKIPTSFELTKHNEAVFNDALKAVLNAKAELEKKLQEAKPE